MALFNNENKQQQKNMIALQNIVLEINEKKLQVSEEFLDQMTKIYISKRLKVINENISSLNKVTSISVLYKKYDTAMTVLEDLLAIEPLHKFNHPTPSEYKASAEEGLEQFILALIGREWRKIAPQNGAQRPDLEFKIRTFLATFDSYMDRLPENAKITLNQLRKSAFPDEAGKEEAAVNTDIPEETPADGFIPETFETFDPLSGDGDIPGGITE